MHQRLPSLPRPEYPRPDRQRGRIEGVDWLNLNGPWQFRFGTLEGAVDPAWSRSGAPDWAEQIIVPFCWESLAAWGQADAASNDRYYSSRVFIDPLTVTGANHRSAPRHEVGWYRRVVLVPDSAPWQGKRAILTIGAADFATDCWCNGVHLGRHEGGYVPCEFDLTAALGDAPGARAALILLRVADPMDNREQPVGKQWGWYTTTSGIWQTVFLEPRSAAHLARFAFTPDIDRSELRLTVECAGLAEGSSVELEILAPQAQSTPLVLAGLGPASPTASGVAAIAPLVLWDPDHPHLYPAILRLRDGAGRVVDEVRSYFGMRKIDTMPSTIAGAPHVLALNNRPIYLRGALYQSYHPDGVYTAGDVSTIRDDIAFARKVGFDFLRIHIKLDDPLVLFWADTLGMLVMQDFPNFGEGGDTPLGRRRFEEMLRAGIARDFNHPAIIAWCIFNESWGFGGQNELIKLMGAPTGATAASGAAKLANAGAFAWIHATWLLAKQLDPTRLIEDMSVVAWEHLAAYGHVDTDINSWHFYIDDYERAKHHIAEVVARTHRGSSFNYIEGFVQGDAPLINSEYGAVGALDGDRDISWSFRFLTNELRLHGQLSAYIFTELTDVEWERNGFLNYDRTAKAFGYDPTSVNRGDVLPVNAPPIARVAPGSRVPVEIFSSHFTRRPASEVVFQWRYSGIDSLGFHHPDLACGHLPIPFTQYRVELACALILAAPEQPMLCTLAVTASAPDGRVLAANQIQHFVSAGPLPAREVLPHAVVLRPRVPDWTEAAWPRGHGDRAEALRDGACWGRGAGSFQWDVRDPLLAGLAGLRHLRVLLELSARGEGTSQTDSERHPSACEITLNGVMVQRVELPDHPHDARGALSYLRGGRGAYGYLVTTTVEGNLLRMVAAAAPEPGLVRLRCTVPEGNAGGLTVYDQDCGRYPCGPTLIIGTDPT